MPVKIRVDQFCNLSTDAKWQAWLWYFDQAMYQDLATHLRTSKGCGQNREFMIKLMGRVNGVIGGQEKLLEFLQQNYPHMVESVTPVEASEPVRYQRPVMAPAQVSPPFERYDPRMLSFPRRNVLQSSDLSELNRRVRAFVSDKVRSDWVIIGDKAYIEFVPSEHAGVAANIPDKSWLVTKWKRENPH
jgi:hypothetical protein